MYNICCCVEPIQFCCCVEQPTRAVKAERSRASFNSNKDACASTQLTCLLCAGTVALQGPGKNTGHLTARQADQTASTGHEERSCRLPPGEHPCKQGPKGQRVSTKTFWVPEDFFKTLPASHSFQAYAPAPAQVLALCARLALHPSSICSAGTERDGNCISACQGGQGGIHYMCSVFLAGPCRAPP